MQNLSTLQPFKLSSKIHHLYWNSLIFICVISQTIEGLAIPRQIVQRYQSRRNLNVNLQSNHLHTFFCVGFWWNLNNIPKIENFIAPLIPLRILKFKSLDTDFFNFILQCAAYVPEVLAQTQRRVVIVGAGLSGYSAAARLLENGITDIVILEAENRIGGRIHSVPFRQGMVDMGENDSRIENGRNFE